MTLLSIVQDVCKKLGSVSVPSVVVGDTSPTTVQMLALLNEQGKILAEEHPWQELTRQVTHTTIAAELQGTVESIMPGFNQALYRTIWNRSQQREVYGSVTPREWQYLKARTAAGIDLKFRIISNNFYIFPAPPAGETIAIEYLTNQWCESSGGTGQTAFAADTDVPRLNELLLTLALEYAYKDTQGMDTSAIAGKFTTYKMRKKSTNVPAPILNAAPPKYVIGGVQIPEYGWGG
jgi:hypothetical protein